MVSCACVRLASQSSVVSGLPDGTQPAWPPGTCVLAYSSPALSRAGRAQQAVCDLRLHHGNVPAGPCSLAPAGRLLWGGHVTRTFRRPVEARTERNDAAPTPNSQRRLPRDAGESRPVTRPAPGTTELHETPGLKRPEKPNSRPTEKF